jgi:hypothetical protein
MAEFKSLEAAYKFVLLATLAIKLVLAYVLPMSGDEAYFIVWARHPDFGYYDHPPMVGWFLQLLLYLGNSEVVLRMPAILLSTLIGISIYRLLKPHDEAKAALVAILYLVSPLNVLNVLVTTDTPLILFAFLSVISLNKALQRDSLVGYMLAGALFGMAFLSKYFALLLGLGYVAYFIFSAKSAQKTKGFALLFLTALPFGLINLYWNYTHCWDNILFNLYNRNEGEQFSPDKIATYLGMQVYLMTPPVIYYLFKHRSEFRTEIRRGHFQLFAWAFLLPIVVLGLLSLKRDVGLHWVLAFYSFFYILLGLILSIEELRKALKFMLWFSASHLAIIVMISAMPMETWIKTKWYDGIVFMLRNDEIVEQVRPYEKQGFLLASDGYTPAAIISYHYGKNFFVFGSGSTFARQDDIITDFRAFKGRDMLIVKKSAPELTQYAPYFQRVEVKEFPLRGVTFYFVLGYSFNYDQYRQSVLQPIKDRYYRIPGYLPHAPCYFCVKYFPEEAS